MGGCATKPKDLEYEQAPVEAPASFGKAKTVPQENKDGEGTKKEEPPLVDFSEPAAPKVDEMTAVEAKSVCEEAVESKPTENKPQAVGELPKEVTETTAASTEKKTDEPEQVAVKA